VDDVLRALRAQIDARKAAEDAASAEDEPWQP
jgi:hypothetical protein